MLRIVGRVRPDERRDAVAAFGTLFGFMVGHAILETARDALFLARLPASQLPWVYLMIALVALTIGQREPRVPRRLAGKSEMSRWLVFAALVTLGFWGVLGDGREWAVRGLYVWSGVLATLLVVRFWTLLGSRFTLSQAKRLFPFVTTGSVAGAIVGSGIARLLAEVAPARHLVLAAGAVFLITSRLPTPGAPPARGAPVSDRDDLPRLLRIVWEAPYLRQVATLVLLATVTFTFVDFAFKSAADRWIAPDELGAFFSSVYLGVGLLSLAVQLGVVAFLLRRAGVMAAVAIVPFLLLTTTVGFAVGGGIVLALMMKGTDGVLRHSVYRTGTELLFLPLSERLRTRIKGFFDVLTQRGGQALASIVILMVLSVTADERIFAGIACVTAAAWLATAFALRPRYLSVFRDTLRNDLRTDVPRVELPELDRASIQRLEEALQSPEEGWVLAALDTLVDRRRTEVIPVLLLHHPSRAVVLRTLSGLRLGRRDDALPTVRELVRSEDSEVAIAALVTVGALGPERELLTAFAAHDDPARSVAARAILRSCGWVDPAQDRGRLPTLARSSDLGVARALALTCRSVPGAGSVPVIQALLGSHDRQVLEDAIHAAGAMPDPELFDPLLALLGRRGLRDSVRTALASRGSSGLARMVEVFETPGTSRRIRRSLPGTMVMTGSRQAPAFLLRRLVTESDGLIRFRILRALGKWRSEQPIVPLDRTRIRTGLEQGVATGNRLREWRLVLQAAAHSRPAVRTEVFEVLTLLLRDKQDHALERVFRMLNLEAGSEDFQRLYLGLHSPRDATRESGRELLRHLVPAPLRMRIVTLVDDLLEEPMPTPGGRDSNPDEALERVLSELVGSGMESVSSLAATLAVELGLGSLSVPLRSTSPLSRGHARTLRDAADRLSGGASA